MNDLLLKDYCEGDKEIFLSKSVGFASFCFCPSTFIDTKISNRFQKTPLGVEKQIWKLIRTGKLTKICINKRRDYLNAVWNKEKMNAPMYGISQREVSNSWKLFQSVMISVISMPLYSLRNICKLKYSKRIWKTQSWAIMSNLLLTNKSICPWFNAWD